MKQCKILAIDPGTSKCGVALVEVSEDGNEQVSSRQVVQLSDLAAAVRDAANTGVTVVAVGGGTGSKSVVQMLGRGFPDLSILVVDERGSSEQARARYWQEKPPRGWRRLVPRGMLTPPECYDDFAAVLLAEKVLAEMRRE